MSPLARRIAWTTVLLLGMQFVSSLILQMALAGMFRAALVTQVYQDLEGSGMFDGLRGASWTVESAGGPPRRVARVTRGLAHRGRRSLCSGGAARAGADPQPRSQTAT